MQPDPLGKSRNLATRVIGSACVGASFVSIVCFAVLVASGRLSDLMAIDKLFAFVFLYVVVPNGLSWMVASRVALRPFGAWVLAAFVVIATGARMFCTVSFTAVTVTTPPGLGGGMITVVMIFELWIVGIQAGIISCVMLGHLVKVKLLPS